MELDNVYADQIVMKLIMNYFWANQDGHPSNTQYDFMFQKGPIIYLIDGRYITAKTERLSAFRKWLNGTFPWRKCSIDRVIPSRKGSINAPAKRKNSHSYLDRNLRSM